MDDPDEEIPNIFEDLNIKDGPFTLDEFRKVKSSIKIGKAAGPDDIPPDVYKSCDFDMICLDMCNRALIENDKPDLWSYMNMILNRIRSVINVKLRYNQNGFRAKRTTVVGNRAQLHQGCSQ